MKVFIVLLAASLLAVFFGITRIYGLMGLLILTLWQPVQTILTVGVVIGVVWQVRGHL